ncbi:MAG: PhzF family phenazine biosynthesis protein [Deltaproteobacteria bacterium]|nr:PhzF family phenazine biosynthesis protein [Deltaproteobacteria bacterium]
MNSTRHPPSLTLPFVQVDAFAEHAFEGNPAAVVRLESWLPDEVLAAIAAENNLSETAFVVGGGGAAVLRWFTPAVEVDLCGHATLAAGAVLLEEDGGDLVRFSSRSGELTVARVGDRLEMELPAVPPMDGELPPAIVHALGTPPVEGCPIRALHHADYWLARFTTAAEVRELTPDIGALRALRSNVICTAPGEGDLDFVSRFFAPGSGVDEDPVTGSAHCSLAPYWVERLGRNPLRARQIGPRGGGLECEVRGARVALRGQCVTVIRGSMFVPREPAGQA